MNNNKTTQAPNKPKNKQKIILGAIGVVVVLGVGGALLSGGGGGNSANDENKYYDNERVDVNGLTVSVACEKLREKGWTIRSVSGVNGGYIVETSDCSDTANKVTGVEYHSDKSIYKDGPSATLKFASDKVHESANDSQGATTEETGNTSSSSNTSQGSNSSNQSQSTISNNASFRKVMDDYEAFMNKYVDFMKKYKNSSDISSMLSDYAAMMNDYNKYANSIQDYDQDNLSADDWAYYMEVTTRVNKKLLEI